MAARTKAARSSGPAAKGTGTRAARRSGGNGSSGKGPSGRGPGTKTGSRPRTRGAGPAARHAVRQNGIELSLPLVGEVCLPAPERLAWYAGVATLVVFGMVEWPVALVITVGHLLGEDHHNRLIEDFGAALEIEA
ncbi:MAG TPA: hypothetical protein VE287_08975 [Actinopolymorphaceae bacterium]|nr:hypothetical protein [Actinopolymorphaceae bacterium]